MSGRYDRGDVAHEVAEAMYACNRAKAQLVDELDVLEQAGEIARPIARSVEHRLIALTSVRDRLSSILQELDPNYIP